LLIRKENFKSPLDHYLGEPVNLEKKNRVLWDEYENLKGLIE